MSVSRSETESDMMATITAHWKGKEINSRFIITAGTSVVPAIHHGQIREFLPSDPQANQFMPERWYSRPDMVVDDAVFAAFSTGTHSCIGKSLALPCATQ
ncbi:hypothetical protein G6O67_006422 [Ophiocordyceps sinensis]|uniref:Cytochrome P450 n=1 Tax=Ophiocordyceps sinensis TaxID=72228 RepID=A0A8H4LVF4_9HYPO|nr:hypothetical protein G6O67_006422 [Ophiocordyceps sinensis]